MRRGESAQTDAGKVAGELAAQLGHRQAAFALVFASSLYDPAVLARELARAFDPVPVFGCTSIGEIGHRGFTRHGAVGLSASSRHVRVGVGCARDISQGALRAGRAAVVDAAKELGLSPAQLDPRRHVGLCLIDWRSQSEELFMAGAGSTAPQISLVGGSTSDAVGRTLAGEHAHESRIFCRGRAIANSALVLILETDLPFRVVATEHMIPRDGRVVVTSADVPNRRVLELDGLPAVARYKEVAGLGELPNSQLAGARPFGYAVNGRYYVRSVMGIEGDALHFACAVERGSVLVPMEPGEMIPTTERALGEVLRELGGRMAALIAFSCYGRFLESEREGTTDAVGRVLAKYPVVGFNTFGEQINTLHVNHTLTGLALGESNDG